MVNYQLKNPMNEETVKRLAIDMCEALVFCQKKGLIHRDIKPANIFVDENGTFKLGDFGVARSAEATMGGYSRQGTENYMAPEVYLGNPYGATVDIYSLGLVLYRMMNGNRLPFYPPAPAPIDVSHRENAVAARLRGDVMAPPCNASEGFAAVILKACAHDSEDRYRTAAEMLEALKQLDKDFVHVESEQKNLGGSAHFEENPEEEEDSEGSIGYHFGMPRKKEDAKAEPEGIDSIQDEESMGSIGINWGKRETFGKNSEDEKETDEQADKPVEPPKKKSVEEKAKKGISPVIVGARLAAIALIGGGVLLFGGGDSRNQTSNNTEIQQNEPVAEKTEMPVAEKMEMPVALANQVDERDVTITYELVETAENPGKNQVNRDALSDDETVLIDGDFYMLSEFSEDEIEDQFTKLKNRLDALDTPYALGHLNKPINREPNEFSGNDFAIRISPEHLGYWICELMQTDLRMYFPEYEQDSYYGPPVQSLDYRWDGANWVVTVSQTVYTWNEVYERLAANEKLDVVLRMDVAIGDYVLGRANDAEAIDFVEGDNGATVTYEIPLDCFADEANQEDYAFVLDLMKVCVEDPSFEASIDGSFVAFTGKESELMYAQIDGLAQRSEVYQLEYGTSEDDQVLTQIQKVFPNARVGRIADGCLDIVLEDGSSVADYQNADGSYDYKAAEQYVLEVFQKLHESYDFAGSSYETVRFITMLNGEKSYYKYRFEFSRIDGNLALCYVNGMFLDDEEGYQSLFEAVKASSYFFPLIDQESWSYFDVI